PPGASTATRRSTGSRRPCGCSKVPNGTRRRSCWPIVAALAWDRLPTASRNGAGRARSPSSPPPSPCKALASSRRAFAELVEVPQPLVRLGDQRVVPDRPRLVTGLLQERPRSTAPGLGLVVRGVLQRLVGFHDEVEDLPWLHPGVMLRRATRRRVSFPPEVHSSASQARGRDTD